MCPRGKGFVLWGHCQNLLDDPRITILNGKKDHVDLDGVSPSVFRCTSTPMETCPIDTCVETEISPDFKE